MFALRRAARCRAVRGEIESREPSALKEQPPPSSSPSSLDRWALRLWRWYKSIQFGMFLLAVIMGICVYGTMHYAANSTLGDNAIPLAKARVFNAGWFFALLGFFFIQFVVSTWHVTKMSLGIWWKRDFTRGRTFLTTGPGRASIPLPAGPDALLAELRRRFTRAHREGNRFFAQKGIRTRLGPTIIHAGIVTILLAGLGRILLDRQGQILSEGRFVAAEGETTDILLRPARTDQAMSGGNIAAFRIPYEITVLDFDEVLHANSNAPAYFSSLLSIKDRATGEVTVAKLDMNHSVEIGGFEFHQAGYNKLPPIQTYRTNFDVRDAATGERIAVADASPETRVQVGDEDLFLEIDGEAPGSAWRAYTSESPLEPVAEGKVLQKAGEGTLAFEVSEIYPDFAFDPEKGPYSRTNSPNNLAARLTVMLDGTPAGQTIVFLDRDLNDAMPLAADRFRLRIDDVRVDGGSREDYADVDWQDPDYSRLVVSAMDIRTSAVLGEQVVGLGIRSGNIAYVDAGGDEPPPAGARYAIYPAGRTLRHETVLSVVREPVVPFYVAGVALIGFGAMMTFAGRYRAFHAEWDEEAQLLHLALVPRFGKERGPDPKEFEELVRTLSGGKASAPADVPGTREPAGIDAVASA